MGCRCDINQKSEEELIEILFQHKRPKIINRKNSDSKLFILDEEARKYQSIFYENINNESNLVKYLTKIKEKESKSIFQYELLLYFDTLSPKNRELFTGIGGFISCINIYKNIIQCLYEFNFEEIKNMNN